MGLVGLLMKQPNFSLLSSKCMSTHFEILKDICHLSDHCSSKNHISDMFVYVMKMMVILRSIMYEKEIEGTRQRGYPK